MDAERPEATNRRKDLLLAVIVGGVVLFAMLALREYRHDVGLVAGGTPLGQLAMQRGMVWMGALGSLAVYTFLVRDNPFYKFFEHAMLGCATGLAVAVAVQDVLVSKWWQPMLAAFASQQAGLTARIFEGIVLLVAGVLGLLWYFQYSKRYLWLSRIPLAIGLGAGAGMAVKGTFNSFLPQVTTTFKSLAPEPYLVREPDGLLRLATAWERVGLGVQNAVFVLGTVSVLTYFFFVVNRRTAIVRSPSRIGRWYLMLMLGAFFGNTFMTRLSALIERVQFLLNQWLRLT